MNKTERVYNLEPDTVGIRSDFIAFERVDRFTNDETIKLPNRKTTASAGYDFYAAEDTIIPPQVDGYENFNDAVLEEIQSNPDVYKNINDVNNKFNPITLDSLAALTKKYKFKPTLVPTGIRCFIPKCCYLQLSVRSSLPLKHWLILANGVGIIDADYYRNPDNDGEIYFQLINLSPFPIVIKKGECFGQGVILPYVTASDDNINAKRTGGFGSTDAK